MPVSRANRFRDLDRTTLERVAAAAGVRGREPVAGAEGGSASESASEPAPNAVTLRLASPNPTTPSTQSSATDLRVTSRTHDDLDRLSSETVPLQDGNSATLAYTYWNNGQRKTVTDAIGRVTFYEYDGRNRLSRLTANQGLPDEHVTSYDYWPDSLLKTVTKPDGTVTSYDYDKADRLRNVAVRKDGTDLLSYAYTYDGNGNRLSQVEVNGGPPETTTYTYDDLNRLETVSYPDGRSVAYGYDNVGNRTAETERDSASVVVSQKVAVFDAANRLSTVTDAVNAANNATFAYDQNGNLKTKTTASGTATYAFDVRDQLVETRVGEQISGRFAYDGFGRRYLKIGNEGIRQYLYDQTSLLEEFTETNVEVAKYEWGGDRLVGLFRFNEPRRYFHFDALGSVAALTEGNGSVAARYHYDAWGRHRDPTELQASANRFGFTGHYFDTETNLYFAKARYYDPEYGRFLTADSFLGELDNPPSLHRYLYANDNPLTFADPDGNESVRQAWGVEDAHAFWSAFGRNVAYNTWNLVSLGTLGRQDRLVELSAAGKIGEAQYWGRTAINAGSSVAIVVAASMTGGAAAAGASALGAGTVATDAVAGVAAGVGGQAATDLIEVGLLETKRAEEVRAVDYAIAGGLGAVLGGALGYAANQAPKASTVVESAPPPKAGPFIDLVANAKGKYVATFDESAPLPRVAGGSQLVDAVLDLPAASARPVGPRLLPAAPEPVGLLPAGPQPVLASARQALAAPTGLPSGTTFEGFVYRGGNWRIHAGNLMTSHRYHWSRERGLVYLDRKSNRRRRASVVRPERQQGRNPRTVCFGAPSTRSYESNRQKSARRFISAANL